MLLRAFLADRDVPCPRCGYNLRTLAGDRCTECGTALMLTVNATEPIQRAWIAAMVAATLGAGIGLMFLALILGEAGLPPREWYWIIGISWAFFPVVAVLIWKRRTFLRGATWVQVWLVAAVCVPLAVLAVGIAKTVR